MILDIIKSKEDAVVVTEDSVIVTVSAKMEEGKNLHDSSYLAKKLTKTIPALDSTIVDDDQVTVVMKVPIRVGRKRNNTVDSIEGLALMGFTIIMFILDNGTFQDKVEAFANDCKPWFISDGTDGEKQKD